MQEERLPEVTVVLKMEPMLNSTRDYLMINRNKEEPSVELMKREQHKR